MEETLSDKIIPHLITLSGEKYMYVGHVVEFIKDQRKRLCLCEKETQCDYCYETNKLAGNKLTSIPESKINTESIKLLRKEILKTAKERRILLRIQKKLKIKLKDLEIKK